MTLTIGPVSGPHAGVRLFHGGSALDRARAAIVCCHGRGGAARDILALAGEVNAPHAALVAPEAVGFSWYPRTFLAPLEENEPALSSALEVLGALTRALEEGGIPPERQVLLGFSQGGCLALEFAGRFPRRFGGVVGLSAGLIGPPGRAWDFDGDLAGTPVFLGASDVDSHIPKARIEETAKELTRIGAAVELQLYPGLGHAVNRDEIARIERLVATAGA